MKTTEIRRIENKIERRVIMGAIVSDQFLREITPVYDSRYLEATYAKLLMGWCIEFYKKYDAAPAKQIQALYDSKRRTEEIDDTAADAISDLLEGMSTEWEQSRAMNIPYLIDQTLTHFKLRSLGLLRDAIGESLESGDVAAADAALQGYKPVRRPSVDGFDPYTDLNAIIAAFEDSPDPLVHFPGALGRFANSQFVRGGFVGLMGSFKRGKSWLLQEIAHRGSANRHNVAYFEVGDMSKDDVTIRTHIRLAGKSNEEEYCGDLHIPVLDCLHNQNGTCPFEREGRHPSVPIAAKEWDGNPKERMAQAPEGYAPCAQCARGQYNADYKGAVWWKKKHIANPLQWREGYKLGLKFRKYGVGRHFRTVVTPAKTTTVRTICATLDMWETFEDFIPDIIVIDYADLLIAEDTKKDVRHQHNEIWMALRALSLDRHALVVTATQADADAMERNVLGLNNFSEDVRKYAHVTAMFTLNQTDGEKEQGLLRIGKLLVRKGKSTNETVTVLQSLQTGQPCIASF